MPVSYRAAQNLIKRGNEEELRAALDDGLDGNLTNENQWSLLMLSAVEGSTVLGKLLLDAGADPAKLNSKGESAETIALKRGHHDFVTLLRERAPL